MKNTERYERAFRNFKKAYACKMGGTQTVILPNGKSRHYDDRKYYEGRGAKYNKSIRHDIIGEVRVSRKAYSEFVKWLRDMEASRVAMLEERKLRAEKTAKAMAMGFYDISESGWVELSEQEMEGKYFDADRLAATLGISEEDARLLKSTGKTYVFAKSNDGNTYLLYHPSLQCNGLNISVEVASKEMVESFTNERENWNNAPYAFEVGQTDRENHFVC